MAIATLGAVCNGRRSQPRAQRVQAIGREPQQASDGAPIRYACLHLDSVGRALSPWLTGVLHDVAETYVLALEPAIGSSALAIAVVCVALCRVRFA